VPSAILEARPAHLAKHRTIRDHSETLTGWTSGLEAVIKSSNSSRKSKQDLDPGLGCGRFDQTAGKRRAPRELLGLLRVALHSDPITG
jgi:hypothetical protein